MRSSAEPLIHPKQLKQARELLGLSREAVAQATGVDVLTLDSWEAGRQEPALPLLESLAELYGRRLDYFLEERPAPPAEVFFRTVTAQSPPALDIEVRKAIAKFEEFCRFEWEIERLSEVSPSPIIGRQTGATTADDLAVSARTGLGLDSRPIRNLRSLLNANGVRTFLLDISGGSLAGMSWWHPAYGPGILANIGDSASRRNFTFAHELGHLLRDEENSVTVCDLTDNESERLSNQFAALFLMPADDVRSYWRTHGDEEPIDASVLGRTAARYGTSIEAIAYRLEDLGLIRSASWLIQRSPGPKPFGRRKPNWRRERGERYVTLALGAYRERRLSVGKLAEYLGTDIRTAQRLAQGPAESTG